MQAIELETTISQNGTVQLPERYRPSFGAKAKVIVLYGDAESESTPTRGQANKLMEFAGKLDWPIADPLAFQQELRKEWDRE